VPATPATLAALRSLLAARFPGKIRKPEGCLPTGAAAVDEALGGGLPAGRVTELVSAAPSSGGQFVLARLLAATRAARQRIALVDGADGFAPEAVTVDELRHLVWVRCRTLSEALSAADLLVRDGNYAVVALDLRGLAISTLRKQPATAWYRLQRAAGNGTAAVIVLTPCPLVPAVTWRLVLSTSRSLADVRKLRDALAADFSIETVRGHAALGEEMAG
jgi:hypothetical protein